MPKRQGGLSRHGYGRKNNQRPDGRGESGAQTAKRTKAAAASAAPAAPAPAPKPAARRGRPAKKAVKPAAKRRELKSDALEEEVESAWGTLPVGTLVLDAQHTNLLMKSKRVYGDNPQSFVFPAEQILHASFDMWAISAPQ